MSLDLTTRYAAETVEVPILDPTDLAAQRDTGARITIRSLYSKEAREAATASRAKLRIVDGKVDATDADFEANLAEQTIAVTVGWTGIEEAGVPLPFTPETCRRIYEDPRTQWVQKQVQVAYLDIGRFFPPSKPTS